MKKLTRPIIYTIVVALLYSYTGSVYLGNYYRIVEMTGANTSELLSRICYFLQAAGMLLYGCLFKKYNDKFNSSIGTVVLVASSIIPMCFVQNSSNVSILIVAFFVFNLITGMIIEMYLVELNYNISNNLALCYGIAYAIGSIFTFLVTYFDGGKFMESPEMTIIYILIVTIASVMLLKGKRIEIKQENRISHNSKIYIVLLIVCIILGTIVVSLGDGIYNFGMWSSNADIRIVRAFYALGLIAAGIVFDKSRRFGTILTVAFLSYYIISAFLVNSNAISPSVMMSLGYVFMSFISVYRYVMVADLSNEYPQFIPDAGYGLMVSRIAEGLTSLFMMLFPVSLTMHTIITLLFYSPLVIVAIMTDNIKYSSSSQSESKRFYKLCIEYNLTSREQEICRLIIENNSDDEIANKLFISKPTVRFHISNIFKKTKAKSRIEIKRMFE